MRHFAFRSAFAMVLGTVAFCGQAWAGSLPVSGASLWLDAGAITGISDGGAVTAWNDGSGNSNNYAGTATYDASNANFNNQATVHFDGSQSLYNSAFNPAFGYTIFAVAKADSPSGNQAYFGGGVSSMALGLYVGTGVNPNNSFWAWAPNEWSTYGKADSVNANTNIHAYTVSSTDETTWSWYLNGKATGAAGEAAGNPIAYSGGTYVGASGAGGGEYWNGDIAEIIVYNSVLNATQIGQVNSYLGEKYGVAVPEPSAIVVLVTGLVGLLAYAWRKRR